MVPKLEWLESFAVFADVLNFTHAASRLHISQPALHTQIRRLSETLDVTLYRRVGRRLELTRAGVDVLRFARGMHERSVGFVEQLRSGHARRQVVLAAGEGALLYLLGPGVQAFARRGPVPLRVMITDREGTLAALRRGDAHVGVAAIDEIPDELSGRTLADVGHALAMPKGHPLARRRSLSLARLIDLPLVIPPRGRPMRETIAQAWATHGASPNVAAEANGWAPMLHLVALGLGVAVVNGCCRLPAGVVARPIPALPRIRYQLLSIKDEPTHDAARALAGALIEHRDDWRSAARIASQR